MRSSSSSSSLLRMASSSAEESATVDAEVEVRRLLDADGEAVKCDKVCMDSCAALKDDEKEGEVARSDPEPSLSLSAPSVDEVLKTDGSTPPSSEADADAEEESEDGVCGLNVGVNSVADELDAGAAFLSEEEKRVSRNAFAWLP